MIKCCRGCTERKVGCHAYCVHYMYDKAVQGARNEARMRENAGAYNSVQTMMKNREAYYSRKYKERDKKV